MGDQDLSAELSNQGYQLVGRHSAVKTCYWTRQSLISGRDCYKGRFYGIQSHRCVQMSPAIDSCNLHCRFCWRNQGWENDESMPEYDDPETLLDRSWKRSNARSQDSRGRARCPRPGGTRRVSRGTSRSR